ncbi:MAG: hypothetical protein LC725_02185 [Lentisphaerae bacterium]|nr:hypothetical protein [Lentisphaerota bacterium]
MEHAPDPSPEPPAGNSVRNKLGVRRWSLPVMLLLVAAALVVGWQIRRRLVLDNFGEVEAGIIYRSGQLTPAQLERLIKSRGIKTIIKTAIPELSLQDMAREQLICNRYNVRVVPLIMPGDGLGEYEQYDRAVELLMDERKLPALITCARGTHRTGAIVAAYRVRVQNWPVNRAMAEMENFRFNPYRSNRDHSGQHPLVEHLRGYFKTRTGYAE